jgi:tetratricopeptide (TPR) repeat protein
MALRSGSDITILWLAVTALTVALCVPSNAQRSGGGDETRNQCQSGDTNKRLVGCTIVINAKGFGSKFELAAAYDARCWAFNELQQYQRGLADCKAAIAIQPRYSYAYQNSGVSLLGLGDLSNAIAAFTKAIELKPNFIFSYLNRAKAFVSLRNNGSAERDFERALTIDPTNQEANEGIAALGNPSPPVVRNEPQTNSIRWRCEPGRRPVSACSSSIERYTFLRNATR